MKPVDPDSPAPLYHQIAEAIRDRIAIGELPAGAALPPLRAAAAEWGVNLHTVRHAYAELARRGLVATEAPHGTRVVGPPPDELRAFVARTLDEARTRFGLSPAALAAELARQEPDVPTVRVLECSDAQCADLAGQLQARFAVDALPWCLDQPGEPPPGPLVATYFHYGEVRRRWPHRSADLAFAAIHPDPGLADRVPEGPVTVCERDQPTADAVAADLSVILPPPRFALVTRVIGDTPPWSEAPLLFAPRVWAALSDADRRRSGAIEVRYLFDRDEIDAVGRRLSWSRRTP